MRIFIFTSFHHQSAIEINKLICLNYPSKRYLYKKNQTCNNRFIKLEETNSRGFSIHWTLICFTFWWWYSGGWWGGHLCSGGGRSGGLYLCDNNHNNQPTRGLNVTQGFQTNNSRKNLDIIKQHCTFFQTLHKTSTLTDEIPHGVDNFS